VIDNLKSRFEYFETVNKYPGAPSVATHEVVNNESFSIGGKNIPINAMHGNLQVLGIELMILLI
jgi:phosphoribosyl 1,2-cyclic phosphate phosphodiesterase